MSLYDDLGVPADATDAEIKSAHRKKVKKHHPDAGGDPAAFDRIQQAYMVLADADRRRRYDETGETNKPTDNSLMAIVNLMMNAFNQAAAEAGPRAEQTDLIARAKNIIATHEAQVRQQIKQVKAEQDMIRRMVKRLRYCGDGPDLIRGSLEQRLREGDRIIGIAEEDIRVAGEARGRIANYAFEFDAPPMSQMAFTTTSNSTSAMWSR